MILRGLPFYHAPMGKAKKKRIYHLDLEFLLSLAFQDSSPALSFFTFLTLFCGFFLNCDLKDNALLDYSALVLSVLLVITVGKVFRIFLFFFSTPVFRIFLVLSVMFNLLFFSAYFSFFFVIFSKFFC